MISHATQPVANRPLRPNTFAIPGFLARIDLEAIAWRATRYPGVTWCRLTASMDLDAGETATASNAVLIRMAPGRGYPGHRHTGVEDVLILAGGYRDEFGTHSSGTFLRYPAGSEHNPVATGRSDVPEGPANPACVLFAVTRGTVDLAG
ncbi:MAG: cupin domain-containing protein [Planctomycetota bacterium]